MQVGPGGYRPGIGHLVDHYAARRTNEAENGGPFVHLLAGVPVIMIERVAADFAIQISQYSAIATSLPRSISYLSANGTDAMDIACAGNLSTLRDKLFQRGQCAVRLVRRYKDVIMIKGRNNVCANPPGGQF